MFIVTGGAGFIGSAFITKLNEKGIDQILVVDELEQSDKWKNLRSKSFLDFIHKNSFIQKIEAGQKIPGLQGIIHMGACSSTTEKNVDFLMENNYRYTATLAAYALDRKVRFVYASSAATYGDGAFGYADDEQTANKLQPLNPYGFSKQIFDLFVLRSDLESKMAGIKFFNVYGPNEAHKGDMRSMVLKAYEQVKTTGTVKLFKSYRPDYKDGEQKRDFIYIKDCTEVMYWLLTNPRVNGIFNLGTGAARTWNDLARAVFSALGKTPSIDYIEMPLPLRDQYQYFTEAKMAKLKAAGCPVAFTSLEEGVKDYVCNYLEKQASL
jgi:ADP-L-glycero-D-manno-heptose 6-epimerase